ncbi:MAG: hypothetical protein WCX23_01180 [Candidatus Paceibacterota bacterium]|jgi:hypothetical protein
MVKKILLTFLLAGLFLGLPAKGEDFSEVQEIKNATDAVQESIKKDALPAWQQCLEDTKYLLIEIKNFIIAKISVIHPDEIAQGIKEEFFREVQEFKESLPETFKGAIKWYETFKKNWF